MGEIDHADNSIDHGVADGDQPIDHAQGEAIDELLQRVGHAILCGGTMRLLDMTNAFQSMPHLPCKPLSLAGQGKARTSGVDRPLISTKSMPGQPGQSVRLALN
jgi:hypothetical protein